MVKMAEVPFLSHFRAISPFFGDLFSPMFQVTLNSNVRPLPEMDLYQVHGIAIPYASRTEQQII